ncbi:MAG: helicase-related protein [Erysipelotrichaceae bacterium]
MKCNRCGNEDIRYFFLDQTTYYCRKCVHFGRMDVGMKPQPCVRTKRTIQCNYQLPFVLSEKQQRISQDIVEKVRTNKDVLVFAACGAGKTELVMELIKVMSNQGKRVGMAIARRQVVLELHARMQQAFHDLDCIAVCEGFTDVTDGDFIICTMHQLYRYVDGFDVLILDEVDAFPYKGNTMLEAIAKQACSGSVVYLTATPSELMLQQVQDKKLEMLTLFERPHGHPIPIPRILWTPKWMHAWILFYFLQKKYRERQPVMIFVGSKRLAKTLRNWIKIKFPCEYVTSSKEDKDKLIQAFKQQVFPFLITTTLMERGITIEGVHIVIYGCEHNVFDDASIIQICGRVGRKATAPNGDAWILTKRKTPAIKRAVAMIREMNYGSIV